MVVLIASVVGWDAVEFAGGYHAFPLVIGLFPASFFLFALTSLATVVATVVILIALFRRYIHHALLLAGAASVCWLLSPWCAARSAFLLGLATRLRQISSPAEIQLVAKTCLSLMPFGGEVLAHQRNIGPVNHFEAEESKRAWDAIRKYSLVHLDDDNCVIFVQPPNVTFVWGAALPGHWGICVGACYQPSIDPSEGWGRTHTIPFADGMVLFRGD
jgi:hypothetical protein